MASAKSPVPTARPKTRTITMKDVANHGNRGLPPESELKVYEFGAGSRSRKAGKGPYE